EGGELHADGGIPVAAGDYIEDVLPSVADDVSRIVEFEFVFAAGTERFRGDHKEHAIAAACEVETEALGAQHLGGPAVNLHFGNRHRGGHVERDCHLAVSGRNALHARYDIHREIGVDGGID